MIYGVALLLTFLLLKLPNVIQELSIALLDFKIPFNWNHGFALIITTLIGYKLFKTPKRTGIFGPDKIKTFLFVLVLLLAYSIAGISNNYGINPHVWALIFVTMTLVYDIFEESFWRGFLNDLLQPTCAAIKYTITGILWAAWHVLIFDDFNQWGGFPVFLLLSVIISFIIGYAVTKTNSVLVAAAIHALLISKNLYVTVICLVIWTILILTWQKKPLLKKYSRPSGIPDKIPEASV